MRAWMLVLGLLIVACSTEPAVVSFEPEPATEVKTPRPGARDASVPAVSSDASQAETQLDAAEPADASQPGADNTGTRTDASTGTGTRTDADTPGEQTPREDAGGPTNEPGTKPAPDAPDDTPVEPDASECDYLEIRARADNSGAPFQVSAEALDQYQCFVYDEAFTAPTQALAIYPIFDNKSVVHHWLLYTTEEADVSKITTQCGSFASNAMLLAGGGPGGPPWFMPKHVGVDLGKGKFILEVHYNNIGAKAAVDRSGARICTTRNLRPETAIVSWLGNQLFTIPAKANDFQVQGRCKPQVTKPIHLLRSWPHMHVLGTRMTMQLDRADGTKSMVFDTPFSFQNQQNVDAHVVLQPGDSLLTTCFFDNPNDYLVGVGERASDEMCNNFVIAYPAGALTTDWFSLVNNACLGPP